MIITSPSCLVNSPLFAEGKAAKVSSVGSCFLISLYSCMKQRNWTAYIVSLSARPQRALQQSTVLCSPPHAKTSISWTTVRVLWQQLEQWGGWGDSFVWLGTVFMSQAPDLQRDPFFSPHRALPQEGHWQSLCYHQGCRTHGEVSANLCHEQGSFLEVSTTQSQLHLKSQCFFWEGNKLAQLNL